MINGAGVCELLLLQTPVPLGKAARPPDFQGFCPHGIGSATSVPPPSPISLQACLPGLLPPLLRTAFTGERAQRGSGRSSAAGRSLRTLPFVVLQELPASHSAGVKQEHAQPGRDLGTVTLAEGGWGFEDREKGAENTIDGFSAPFPPEPAVSGVLSSQQLRMEH